MSTYFGVSRVECVLDSQTTAQKTEAKAETNGKRRRSAEILDEKGYLSAKATLFPNNHSVLFQQPESVFSSYVGFAGDGTTQGDPLFQLVPFFARDPVCFLGIQVDHRVFSFGPQEGQNKGRPFNASWHEVVRAVAMSQQESVAPRLELPFFVAHRIICIYIYIFMGFKLKPRYSVWYSEFPGLHGMSFPACVRKRRGRAAERCGSASNRKH